MPETESETVKNKETQTVRANDPAGRRKPPLRKGAKWAIVLLSILSAVLLLALLTVAVLPRLIERDVNNLLQRMARGGGIEFKIKSISLSSAEVACKLIDTSGGTPRNVGGIGSLSIRFSPVRLLFDRTVDAVDIENCDAVADYSDGRISVPAYDIFARMFTKDNKKDSPPVEDLNAVIPVRVGRVSISGALTAETHDGNTDDILHIPYAVTLHTDHEQGWNKLDCSLKIQFATNAIQGQAVYLHKERIVRLDLENFAFSTSTLPGAIRSRLPRGLRTGFACSSKAEFDLNTFTVLDGSYIDGSFTLDYRRPDGLIVDSSTPVSLKMVPRPDPVDDPAHPSRPESILVLTLGELKGEYDKIPFELGDLETAVSLRDRTIRGAFRLTAADSEPAVFSFSGGMNDSRSFLDLVLENNPRFRAEYRGMDVDFRPAGFVAGLVLADGGFSASADLAGPGLQAGFDGAGFKPELGGTTASFKPESFSAHFTMNGSAKEITAEFTGGEVHAGFKGVDAVAHPDSLHVVFSMDGALKALSAKLTGGRFTAEKDALTASFKPESFSAELAMADGIKGLTAELKGVNLNAKFNDLSCDAKSFSIDVVSDTTANVRNLGTIGADADNVRAYRAVAEIADFHYTQKAGGLVYNAPGLTMNAEYSDGRFSGDAVCGDSMLTMPDLKLLARNLKWDFPFDLTFAANNAESSENADGASAAAPRTGRISLGDFEVNDIQAASLDGTILWDDAARALRLRTDARIFSIDGKICADIAFGANGLETECGIDIPEQQADLSKDLANILPQFEEISCTGRLGGSAVYRIQQKKSTGHAEFAIADADLFIPEKKLEIRGIDLGFEMPEIAILKSAPGQTLSFDSLKFGKIETGPAKATFRMESANTWQIENALLDWCNGRIRIGGITYRKGQTSTEIILYCDRLELPVFLTQIGLGNISGNGSINGTIPVILSQKSGKFIPDNIYFEDAFLFSTPGEDGLIKGEIDESIANAGTGLEMELATEALKDFTYSWLRLRMISTGPDKEDLKISFELDGRPNRELYYSFDDKTSSVITSAVPCIFKGIRLDANMNVQSGGKVMELVDYFRQLFSKGD